MCYLFNKDMFPLCEESIILIEIWPWEDIAYSRTAQILFILNISLYLFHHYLMVLSFVSGQHYKIWHLGNKCVNSVWQCRCVTYWLTIKEHKKKYQTMTLITQFQNQNKVKNFNYVLSIFIYTNHMMLIKAISLNLWY